VGCEMWNVECEMWNGEWRMWNVECGMHDFTFWNLELGFGVLEFVTGRECSIKCVISFSEQAVSFSPWFA